MKPGMTRKDFLQALAVVGGAAGLQACGDGPAGAQEPANDILRPGNLYGVGFAQGVRAGIYGEQGGGFEASRYGFETREAYEEAGHWYFAAQSPVFDVAVRSLVTRTRRAPVVYSTLGVRTPLGTQFASSIGTVTFSGGESGNSVECQIVATNFGRGPGDGAAARGVSPYFVCRQVLEPRSPDSLSAVLRDRINAKIEETVQQTGLSDAEIVYL